MRLLRASAAALVLGPVLMLGACVNKEPQERAAFIQLLQTRAAQGVFLPLPPLGGPDKDALGDYADTYGILTRFQSDMAAAAQPLREVLQLEALQSVEQIAQRAGDLRAARETLAASERAVREARERADKARSELELPPDLAPVFDGVYDEAVSAPAADFTQAAGRLDAVARHALDIADFVAAHPAEVTLRDGQAQVDKPSLQRELNQRLEALNAMAADLESARGFLAAAAGPSS